jgi:hypothetical protein
MCEYTGYAQRGRYCWDGVDDRPKGGMAWASADPWSCEKSRSSRLSLVKRDGWEMWIRSGYITMEAYFSGSKEKLAST